MRLIKKKLTLTKKTLFLYQKHSNGRPDPTMATSATVNTQFPTGLI